MNEESVAYNLGEEWTDEDDKNPPPPPSPDPVGGQETNAESQVQREEREAKEASSDG